MGSPTITRIRLGGFGALALAVAMALAAPLTLPPAVQADSLPTTQTLGESNLSWQQRFLGIVPIVKPNPKDPIVVTVNGTPITATQVDEYSKTEAQLINATSTDETNAVWKDATENLIYRELLLQEANRRKITIPDAEVAQRAREYQVAGAGGEAVAVGGAPDAQLMDVARGSMEIEKMLDDEFRAHHVTPTEQHIQQYYDEHKDRFVKDPGEVQLSHIAIKLPPDATDAQKAAAEKKIRAIYAEALKTKDFAALARKDSDDDKSAPKGGDLGYFRPGQLPPVVDEEVFATPVGQLTPIIASNLGYSFIKVTARRGTTTAALSEIKPKIAMALLSFNEEAVVKAMLKQLSMKSKIEFRKPPGSAA